MSAAIQHLQFSTEWTPLEIMSEPDVQLNFRGYAPYVLVKRIDTNNDFLMYISAKSLAEQLDPLRKDNAGQFTGLRLEIRKESTDKFAKYEVKQYSE